MEEVALAAVRHGVKIRGYVSCVVGCPYEGYIMPEKVLPVSLTPKQMKCKINKLL